MAGTLVTITRELLVSRSSIRVIERVRKAKEVERARKAEEAERARKAEEAEKQQLRA